jgi:predicted DNA-binding transcriptional regulator AlpA
MSTKTEIKQLILSFDDISNDTFLRRKDFEMLKITPFSNATLYRKIKLGDFPRPIKIGSISVWRVSSLREWLKNPSEYKTIGDK